MLPLLKNIRELVKGYVAALPVAYRTTTQQPIVQSLKEKGHERTSPMNLDPFTHTRTEMADFAAKAQRSGII